MADPTESQGSAVGGNPDHPFNTQAQLALSLIQARATQPLTLVAIDGHSTAGKSSFARSLAAALPHSAIVHADDFYRPMEEDERAALDPAGGYASYYDWERLRRQVLLPLSQGRRARYQRYDWPTNCLGEWERIEPAGVVVVEGCYAARPELRPFYQAIVLVVTSAERRQQRQAQRSDPAEWVARWDAAEHYYMRRHRPESYADLIVRGDE